MVIEVNTNGGVYTSGKAFPYEEKAQIAMVYNQMIVNYEHVSARTPKKTGVGKTFANNIISKMKAFGDVVQPPEAKERDILCESTLFAWFWTQISCQNDLPEDRQGPIRQIQIGKHLAHIG